MFSYVSTGAITPASQADELRAVWAQQAADTAKEREAKEESFKSQMKTFSEVFGPYALAAQAFVQGAIDLSHKLDTNWNAEEWQSRALKWIDAFVQKGWVPPAFNPATQYAAGYGDLLQGIFETAERYPVLNRFGILFKRYAQTDPLVQAIGNASAKSWGFFSGQTNGNQRLYPERALLAARLIALDKGVSEKALIEKALATWNAPIDWSPVPRDSKGNPSDTALYTASLAYTFNIADAWGSEFSKQQKDTAVKVAAGAAAIGIGWWLFRKGVFRGF